MNGIFRIADGTELTLPVLDAYITKNEQETSKRYKRLREMYDAEFSIFKSKEKDPWKPDNRIGVGFPKYIVDTMNGFFMGVPVKVTADDPAVADFVNFLDAYNDQDDQNAELAKLMQIFGRAYEMYFVDEDGNIGITYLDPMESFMIYDESILDRPRFFVRTYKDTNGDVFGSLSDGTMVRYFQRTPELKWLPDLDRPHGFAGVPAVEYICNAERQGLFEPVTSMIDAYNKALSEKANDTDYFADAYLKVLGAPLNDRDIVHMRSNRVINYDGVPAADIDIGFLEKPSADETQENLLNRLERLIYQVSMVANINDENFGEASGISLKYKLQSMSNLAKTLERKFTSGMNRRYRLIFSNPVAGVPDDAWTSLQYRFTRNFPANESEEAEIAAKLSGIVSEDTQLSILSIVDDVEDEIRKKKEEGAEALDGFGFDG